MEEEKISEEGEEMTNEHLKAAYLLSLANSGMSHGNIEHFYNLFLQHLALLTEEKK